MKRFCIALLLISILFCFAACTAGESPSETSSNNLSEKQIDWSLHGTWAQNGQATQDAVTFTFTGAIPSKADPSGSVQTLSLSISWPEAFTYANQDAQPFSCNAYISENTEASAIFVIHGSSYNTETELAVAMTIYLCPEKEYVVVQWDDNQDLYLVASTNPEVDSKSVMEHFQNFLQTYPYLNIGS